MNEIFYTFVSEGGIQQQCKGFGMWIKKCKNKKEKP